MAIFDGLMTSMSNSADRSTRGAGGVRKTKFDSYGSSSSSNDYQSYLNMLSSITDRNNAIAIQNAREQMGFQAQQAQLAQKFNSLEAEKNRLWQEKMSNTSHQREVQDLIKAGLNPVLSANFNGASTPGGSSASSSGIPNGAQAQVDTSLASALVNLMSATLNSSTALATNRYSVDRSFESSKYSSDTSSAASRYSSDQNLIGTIIKSVLGIIDFF